MQSPERRSDPAPDAVLSVVEEDLQVLQERQEAGTVRVSVEPQTVSRRLELEWWTEDTEIERRSINAPATKRREPWSEGEVLVVPVYEERLVVTRTLTLVEELRLRKVRKRHVETQQFPVREDRVHIERLGPEQASKRDESPGHTPCDPPTP